MEEMEIIKLWKELGVDYVNFEFSCGGDSMNDTSIQIYDDKGSEIDCGEIRDYIDDVIYRKVDFYEASDGHYMGEAGNVEIRLSIDGEELEYSKSSQSEWCERITSNLEIELEEKEVQFIKNKVLNINGGEGDCTINYKVDCILTDEEEEIVDSIENKINDECRDFSPDTLNDCTDWYAFTTNEQGDEIEFNDNALIVRIENEYYEYRDE
jgi:hypothetical protein